MSANTVDPTNRLVALDAEGLIAADLPCSACGYLLRTQSPDGACPECGTAVSETLNASNIRLLPLDWLRRIQAGSVCLAIAVPMMWLFGLGLLVWLLGVITLTVEVPKSRPEFKRLQRLIVGSGVATALTLVVLFAGDFHGRSEWEIFTYLGVAALLLGVHLASVLRYVAQICDRADWPRMRFWGNALACFGLVWPALLVGTLVLVSISIINSYGGTAPPWLGPLLVVVGIPASFGGMAFIAGQFIFWIVVAARMHRIRREALVIYHDAKSLAAQGPRV